MEKKVVLITGCCGGIGQELCKKFSTSNYYVIGTDLEILWKDNPIHAYMNEYHRLDLFNQKNNLKEIQNSLKNKRLDVLVNNAAYCGNYTSIEETSIDEFRKIIGCNLTAPFILIKNFLDALKKTRGCIVNIASVHSVVTSDKIAGYAASKSGLVGLTRNMAIEFSKYGIRVNSVSPGAIDTPMLRKGLNRNNGTSAKIDMNKLVEDIGNKSLVGRVGQPKDIAETVYFLADSDKSGNITGTNLLVDGGVSIKLSSE